MLHLNTPYNPSLFNTLPDIDRAVDIVDNLNLKEALDSLGPIFREHGMTDKLGVTLVHRHFELGNREILVESSETDGNRLVSVPWTFHGEEIVGPSNLDFWNSFEFPTGKAIQPQAWTFGDNLALEAFEFEMMDAEGTGPEEPPKDFLAAVVAELEKYQLQDMIGIRVGSSDPRQGIEMTDVKNRANIVTFGPAPDIPGMSLVTVDWGFDADGKVVDGRQCIRIHDRHMYPPMKYAP